MMSWATLLGKHVIREPPSKAELDDLRSIVNRSLKDVAVAGLSEDARFVLAYDAARTLSLIVVRAEGYRPKSIGGHYNTFLALEAVDPSFASQSVYFDGCRMKRNACECSSAGGVSETDADGVLKEVQQFVADVDAWIKTRHPSLA